MNILKDTGPITVEESQVAQEILATRSEWLFYGLCPRGTKFPGGTGYIENPLELSSAESSEEYALFFGEALMARRNPGAPLFVYSVRIPGTSIEGTDYRWKSLPQIVLSSVPSKIKGTVEVTISGFSGGLDSRNIAYLYTLSQRIDASAAEKLFTKIKERPNFFETFYQTAFPGLDSQKDKYDGLYRFMANKLILLDAPIIEKFAKENPEYNMFGSWQAKNLLDNSPFVELNSPIGVGTVEDFNPIYIDQSQ